MYTLQLSGFLLRRFNTNYAHNRPRLISVFGKCETHGKASNYRRKIGLWIREQGTQVAQACTRQFEFIVAQRIRRTIQIFHLYTRLWDEVALKDFLKSWQIRMAKNTRHFLISAVGVTVYNWDRERISDAEVNSYKREIERIHKLRNSTVVCATCQLRKIIDSTQPGINYCKCNNVTPTANSDPDPEGWEPFIEQEDMLIWRRRETSSGLFAYKVYGSFSDITAEDFLQAQIDVDYRKEWDTTACESQIVDTDPKSRSSKNQGSDVIYWEMKWPSYFANRDYVFQRRWVVDRDQRLIVIVNKVTEHPDVPAREGVYRVTTYWSYMVIRPYAEFHQPGVEFGLTYFDDPGVNIPSAVTEWVSMRGLSRFLSNMRHASKEYQKYKSMKQGAMTPITDYVAVEDDVLEEPLEGRTDETKAREKVFREGQEEKHDSTVDSGVTEAREETDGDTSEDVENTTSSTTDKDRGLLHYFFLSKLFA